MIFDKGWCLDNRGYPSSGAELERLISVVPTQEQIDFSDMEYYSFIHFNMNTFSEIEWGTGQESPSLFNPESIDTDQWCEMLKASGSKAIILTAKHHDGFCLWPSKYTEHSVKNSPYMNGRGDVVKQLAESCRRYSMKLGLYLSPWDRHEPSYGTDEYNDFYINQLTELCTQYGEVFEFWFDGACGEGANGKRQVYDFERYFDTIKKHQPKALTAICGRDVRWIGNEAGKTRESEWSVVAKACSESEGVAKNSQSDMDDLEKLQQISCEEADLGSRELLSRYKDLIWYPAEADTSINPKWFYRDDEHYTKEGIRIRSGKELAEVYFNTVGGNATLLLNVPPSRRGIIEEREIKLLKEFKSCIDAVFSCPVKDFTLCALSKTDERTSESLNSLKGGGSYKMGDDEYIISCRFNGIKQISTISIREDIRFSQRVEYFELYAGNDGEYERLADCTVIGSKKIIRLKKAVKADEIRLVFTQSRSNPVLRCIEVFG